MEEVLEQRHGRLEEDVEIQQARRSSVTKIIRTIPTLYKEPPARRYYGRTPRVM